jgi:hypothetical protein
MGAFYKAYEGERTWRDIGNRLQVPHYLSMDEHYMKIRARKQRTNVGKFSCVNGNIADSNQLPEGVSFQRGLGK